MPTPPDDVLLNKASIIERCIRRIQEEAAAAPQFDDYTHLDALRLNVERACQAAIDMAMHVIAERHLGMPQSMGDAFVLLERGGFIDQRLSSSTAGSRSPGTLRTAKAKARSRRHDRAGRLSPLGVLQSTERRSCLR
jgi:hypothetical protein